MLNLQESAISDQFVKTTLVLNTQFFYLNRESPCRNLSIREFTKQIWALFKFFPVSREPCVHNRRYVSPNLKESTNLSSIHQDEN